MKKIFALLLAVILLINMSFVTAFASDNITLDDVVFDGDARSYTISGRVNSTRNRIPMSLFMTHETKGTIAAVETLAVENSEGEVRFSFPEVFVRTSLPSGNITIKIVAGFLKYTLTASVYFYGIDDYYASLNTLKAAIESGMETDLKNAIISTKDILSIDESLFTALSDSEASLNDSASIALRKLFDLEITLPTGNTDAECYDTDEEAEQILGQVEAYRDAYKEAIVLGNFFEISSTDTLKSWYDTNKDTYGFSNDISETTFESKLNSYFDEAIIQNGYISRINNITFVRAIDELNLEMKKQAVLQIVEKSNQNAVSRVLDELSPILSGVYDLNGQNPVSVNYSLWIGLTDDQQSTVCTNVACVKFNYIYDFVNAVNNQINNVVLSSGNTIYDTNTGSGAGRGDKGGSSKPITIPVEESAPFAPVVTFEDIEHVAWAEKAIHYLYTNKIIVGRTEKTFDPDNKVTRAELVKMLVLGLGLEGDSSAKFADVSSGAWYEDYVGIAAANDLIFGDENGRFNPEQPVSRQDAAVMMYRAIGANEVSDKADFEDYSLISSYAQDAVNYMYKNCIVNGVGDGTFSPIANLTRAQAAKMIYSLLIR